MAVNKSIEKKVFLIFGGFTLLVGLTFSIVAIIAAFTIEDAILEKVLAHEAQYLENQFKSGNKNPKSRLDYMVFYSDLSGAPIEIIEAKQKNPFITEVFSDSNHHYHITDVIIEGQQFGWLVADVTKFLSVSNQSNNLLQLAIILLTMAILFSLWLAYRIALRTTKPLTNLAKALERQAKSNASLDMSEFKTGDEIEYLANTIENALTELNASLQRESDFNRDVSHELRTPLTVINNTLALSQQRNLNALDQQRLLESADKITRIVKTLLALARSETLALEAVNLRAIVEESVLFLEQKLSEENFEIHLNIPEDTMISGSAELIMLLSNNLIENAIRYATDKSLTISYSNSNLSFNNKGDSELLANTDNIIQPNIKQQDSVGFGQGLYLVNRIANRLGWLMSINADKNNYQINFVTR